MWVVVPTILPGQFKSDGLRDSTRLQDEKSRRPRWHGLKREKPRGRVIAGRVQALQGVDPDVVNPTIPREGKIDRRSYDSPAQHALYQRDSSASGSQVDHDISPPATWVSQAALLGPFQPDHCNTPLTLSHPHHDNDSYEDSRLGLADIFSLFQATILMEESAKSRTTIPQVDRKIKAGVLRPPVATVGPVVTVFEDYANDQPTVIVLRPFPPSRPRLIISPQPRRTYTHQPAPPAPFLFFDLVPI